MKLKPIPTDRDLYCNGKRTYTKKGVVTAINLRFKEAHTKLRMYECEDCNYWHITKQISRGRGFYTNRKIKGKKKKLKPINKKRNKWKNENNY